MIVGAHASHYTPIQAITRDYRVKWPHQSRHRNMGTARRFFEKATRENGAPEKIAMDKSGTNKAAIDEINGVNPKRDRERQSDAVGS